MNKLSRSRQAAITVLFILVIVAQALAVNKIFDPAGGSCSVSNAGAITCAPKSGQNFTVTLSGGGVFATSGPGAVVDATTPVVLAVSSAPFRTSASTVDAVTTYTLPPAASVPGKEFCFAADLITGSNREIDVEPQGASDQIIGTTTPAGGTGIASTAGPAHGAKNTHATAVKGNAVCLRSDGVLAWRMTSLSGIWAAY